MVDTGGDETLDDELVDDEEEEEDDDDDDDVDDDDGDEECEKTTGFIVLDGWYIRDILFYLFLLKIMNLIFNFFFVFNYTLLYSFLIRILFYSISNNKNMFENKWMRK